MNGHNIRIKLLWFQWNLTSEQSSIEMLLWLERLKLPRGLARWQPYTGTLGSSSCCWFVYENWLCIAKREHYQLWFSHWQGTISSLWNIHRCSSSASHPAASDLNQDAPEFFVLFSNAERSKKQKCSLEKRTADNRTQNISELGIEPLNIVLQILSFKIALQSAVKDEVLLWSQGIV